MTKNKKIAVVCNYALNPNRIGGMDRFWVAYDQNAKALGYEVDWYFSDYTPFEFFSKLTICSASTQNIESFFLEKVRQEQFKYDILVTHFLALCTSFFKKAKVLGIEKIISVDHNPRPLEGFPLSKIIKNKVKGILYSQYIEQFVGVSEYTQKHILKDYGFFLSKKTSVIYNGIDTSVFVKRTQENKNKFIPVSYTHLTLPTTYC
jgi:glycosyltransferase involved in cell wall biosynthesis